MLPPYAELHCLSNFSFLRGASHPEELVERAQAQGYAALALTDECSVAGVVRGHLAAKEARPASSSSAASSRWPTAEARAARHRPRELRRPRAADHARPAQCDQGQLRADARRRRAAGAPLSRVVDPSRDGRDDRATARMHAGSPTSFRGRAWIAVELLARAGERARLARLQALARKAAACRWSPPATSTCTRARAARCRTR